ncbi:MAG: hypothetical protein H0X62_01925 [Bacteroidetes bacterium]|nr:hypothetical protein [Bacteroidota bacterium]
MLKRLTIEKIITTAIIITSILLIIAFYSFYQNHKKLKMLQEQLQDTEIKLNLDQYNIMLNKIILPDAREVFRPGVLQHHPVNGLQLSVLEYLFSTYSYNAYLNEESNLKSNLKNLLHTQKKYEIFQARHKQWLTFLYTLSFLIAGLWLLFINQKKQTVKASQTTKEFNIGPPGFFYPMLHKNALGNYKVNRLYKIPRRHFTNLLLDIKEIGRNKKSYINRCYNPTKGPKGNITN